MKVVEAMGLRVNRDIEYKYMVVYKKNKKFT